MTDEVKNENTDSEMVEAITPQEDISSSDQGTDGDLPTVDDYLAEKREKEALAQKLREIEDKNRKLYARVSKKSEPLQTSVEPSQEWQEKMERRFELKSLGYSKEDIAFIEKNGGSIEDPYVKAAVTALQAQRKAEKAADITSSGQSDIEKKFSTQELKGKSLEELESILPRG